jgi:hypothetical protein
LNDVGVAWKAFMAAISAIQVEPTTDMSGVLPPAMAVVSLS